MARKQQEEAQQQGLATRPESAIALSEMEQDAGAGTAEIGIKDVTIPFMGIIQSNSPQLKASRGEYIDGAKEGMVFNTVTGELFEEAGTEGILVIPCYYRREILEWRLREKGGGLVGVHPLNTELLAKTTRDEKSRDVINGTDHHLAEHANHFVMLPDHQTACISMTSTQLKISRRWNTMITSATERASDGHVFTPPVFSRIYRLKTVPQKNDKGDWMGWQVSAAGKVEDRQLYAAAREFSKLVEQGGGRLTDPAQPESDEAAA